MLFIGRSLALSPEILVKMGTLGNHLLYTLVVYYAIKRLKSGKYIMAVIAMFPTAFVLSTTYGYDYWITAFTMLGFAYFFYEVQSPEEKIRLSSIMIIIGSFIFGLGPKAIYFPLMLLLYLMGKRKFPSQINYKGYMIAVTCSILLVFASFFIHYLISGGGGEGDYRGSDEVNAVEQTKYILRNPISYAGTLIKFLQNYLNIPSGSFNFTTNFAIIRPSSFFHLVWVLLLFVIITDRHDNDLITSTWKYKIIVSFVVFATIALFSTALYITFTAVGANSIRGVQGRYLFPVLFPFLYVVGGLKITNSINKTMYSSVVFGIMSFVLLYGAWENLVPK